VTTNTIRMIPYADLCTASGCSKKAKGYSRHCAKHQHREQAWGHELQEPVDSTQLKEPMQRLERWYRTHEGKLAIDAVIEHFVTMAERRSKEYSEDLREMMRTGIKYSTPHHQTTQFIAEVYQSKDAKRIVMEQLALGILLEESPGMFRNDTTFLFTTTHTFMRRSAAKLKYRFRPKQGKAVATTRYISRRTRRELGRWLTREIVYFGVMMYRQWQKDAAEDKQGRAKVTAAIRGYEYSLAPDAQCDPISAD
jgi:hypothetical protein